MRSPAARGVLLVAVTVAVVLAGVAVVPAPGAGQSASEGTTRIVIDLGADGDARFTVVHALPLDSEAEVDAFDRLADAHVSGSAEAVSIEPFERAVAGASEATDRQMTLRDVSRTAARENRTGRLAVTFTWTAFARVDDERLVLGDAFQTPRGTWLPGLDAGQELVITFPDGFTVQSVSRPLSDGEIHIEGPATFEPGTPSAVLTGTPPPWWTGQLPIAAGGVVVLLVGAAAIYVFRERLSSGGGEPSEDEPSVPMEADNGAHPDADAVDVNEPLLSDEERVLRLLEAEGGRMKQVEIVEATDWSNAKVSQLLTEMEAEGQIDKLRIGRENLISLPGEGPGSR